MPSTPSAPPYRASPSWLQVEQLRDVTQENRARYDRSKLRYPSDLTDEEWAHIGPLILPAKPGGNKRTVDVQAVVNGVMYILSTGCQ